MSKNNPMSINSYLKNNGQNCPVCYGTNITGTEVEVNNGTATQNMFCGDCESSWLDTYKLIHYTELDIPN